MRELEAAGVPRDDISIVASIVGNWYSDKGRRDAGTRGVDRYADGTDDRAEGAGAGAGIGAAIGSAAGLLAGLGLLAIPGLGPVVAAGWLASTAAGATAGASTGVIVGALTQAGVDDGEAHFYAEGMRRGGTLVSARVPDADRPRYEAMLDRSSVNIADRGAAYRKGGWRQFDPKAKPRTADEVRREREMYRSSAA